MNMYAILICESPRVKFYNKGYCASACVGKIKTLALTNFDTKRLQIILENEIPIVSNQVSQAILLILSFVMRRIYFDIL